MACGLNLRMVLPEGSGRPPSALTPTTALEPREPDDRSGPPQILAYSLEAGQRGAHLPFAQNWSPQMSRITRNAILQTALILAYWLAAAVAVGGVR